MEETYEVTLVVRRAGADARDELEPVDVLDDVEEAIRRAVEDHADLHVMAVMAARKEENTRAEA